ncbi:hypothetical protein [Candidatus Burkholderia verschuerenii]|uniref:hypothetical protein n=1 Tax=Candidatus Burkholderia verschuerenii TaxID=242163 RepID=UPI000A93C99C|nr:hypothetical protein [Candidatus Burkholderia verschuerenii]
MLGALVSSQLEISVRNDFLANRTIVSAQAEAAAASTLLTAQYDKMRELVSDKERFFSRRITISSSRLRSSACT